MVFYHTNLRLEILTVHGELIVVEHRGSICLLCKVDLALSLEAGPTRTSDPRNNEGKKINSKGGYSNAAS